MGVRGPLLLLLLLLVAGGVGGWTYAESASDPTLSDTAPSPVAAADPAIPYTPPQKTRPDSDVPPLPVSFVTHDEKVGVPGEGGVVVPVPDGWVRIDLRTGEARWEPPGDLDGGYGVRVQVVDLQRTLAQVVAERVAALPYTPGLTNLEILDEGGDTLQASYILAGYSKLQVIRWLSFDGNGIDLEISATGRTIDGPGMEALVSKIATEVYRQQPHEPRPGSTLAPST